MRKTKVELPITGERGQAFVIVLIFMLVSSLIIGPLMSYMFSGRVATSRNESKMDELYTADAGVEDGIYQIKAKSPLLPEVNETTTYTPGGSLNSNNTSVSIFCLEKTTNGGTYKVTSAGINPRGSTTVIESWVESMPSFWDNAITSAGAGQSGIVNLGNNSEVNGRIAGAVNTNPLAEINGPVIPPYSLTDWPFTTNVTSFRTYYWTPEVSANVTGNPINVQGPPAPYPVGPGNHGGSLDIENMGASISTAKLEGSIYVSGATSTLTIGQNSNNDFTLDLNYQTIYVEGGQFDITQTNKDAIDIGGKVHIKGSGIIIAEGNINFQPNLTAGNSTDFVFVMSLKGRVYMHPSGTLYGSVAGLNVDLGSGNILTHTDPPVDRLNFPSMPRALQAAVIRTWNIRSSNSLLIASGSLPRANPAEWYTASLLAMGGKPPYTWSPLKPLSWLDLDPGSGALTGTAPATPGTFDFPVTVTDSAGDTDSKTLSITVGYPGAARFEVAGYLTPSTAGVSSNFTVTAKDSDNNTLAGYAGTVHFSSTDTNPSTLLPVDYTFVPSDNGVRVFSANLTRAGIWSITVAETTNPTVTGKQNGIQINPAPFDHYSVSRIPNPQTVNIPFSVTIQAQDKYNNDRTAGLEPAETVSITFGVGQTGSPASVDTTGGRATVSDLVLTQVKNAQTITFTGATPARTGVSNFFDVSSVPTLYPSQDSYIEQASPDQNFGSSLVLREGKFASVKDKTLVQFDLSVLPPTANVTNAELKLYSADIDSSGVKAYRLKQSWVEDQVTWNRADIGTLWIVPGAYSEPSGELVYDITGNFYSWNVTADVQKFVSGEYTNYGWIIYGVLSGTYNATFVSSEETPSAHSPRLIITY